MNKQQEPRLRFKGFTGTWEEKTLNDVSEVFEYGLNAQAVNFDGVHKYIRITDIDDESRQFLQENVTSPDVDFLKADNYKLQKGDLLFARTGASVGKSYLYNENDGLVYFAGFLIRAKLNKEVDDQFIFQNTLTNHFNRFVTLTSQRSGQPGINSKEYSEFEFLAPTLPEQTHLGLFFSRLDSQIAESRAVLEKSRQLKKAMLAKMFPANGEKIPKIRFKGFEGEWECRKLGDIANFLKGKGLSKSSVDNDGKTPCILYGELYTKYGCYIGKVVSSTSESIENPILTKSNDILLPTSDVTPNGLAKACSIYFDNIVLGGDILVIRSAEILGLFFSYYVESNPLMIIEKATGTTVFHIYEKDLRDIVLLLPSYEEQTAIGNFFRQLDETIALQSAEVEKLNQLKKGLLAAMLV